MSIFYSGINVSATSNFSNINALNVSLGSTYIGISNVSSINASHTNTSSTSLYVTNAYIANVSGINASFMNLSLGSTYIGISNVSSINASHTNTSSTSLYVTNSYIANVSGINASFMNLSLGSTYIGISNVSSINGSFINVSTTSADVTNAYIANVSGINASFMNLSLGSTYIGISNVSSINGSFINVSTTSAYVTNSYIANVSGINASFMNLSLGSTYIGISNVSSINGSFINVSTTSADVTNAYIANVSGINASFENISSTSLYVTNSYIANVSGINASITNASITNLKVSKINNANITVLNQHTLFGINTPTDMTSVSITGFGYKSLNSNTTGNINCAFGGNALNLNTTGEANNAFGYGALSTNTTGQQNDAFGYNALANNTTGYNNNAFGTQALTANKGNRNTAFGSYSDQYTSNILSNKNTAIGYSAITATNVSKTDAVTNSTAIGANSNCNSYSGSTALGYNATCTASNQIMIGTTAETVVIPGNFSSKNASFTNVSIMNLTGINASFMNLSLGSTYIGISNVSSINASHTNTSSTSLYVTNAYIANVSGINASFMNLSLGSTCIGISNVSSINASHTNTSSTSLYVTNSYIANVSGINASFMNLSLGSTYIGTTNISSNNASFSNISFTTIANGSTTITNMGINTSNASFTNVSIMNLTVNGTLFGGSSGPNASFTNVSVLGNFSMPSTAYMNVSNATFTNVSVTNLSSKNATIGILNSSSIYYSQKNININLSTILGTTTPENLGYSCALNATGDIVAVGSILFTNGTFTNAGKLQIFKNQNGTWTNMATILGTTVSENLGYSCALNATGDIVAVGSYSFKNGATTSAGKLQIFQNQNGTWTNMATILGTTAFEFLGNSCALNATGDIVAVGSPYFKNGAVANAGKLQILQNQNGTWTNMATILGTTGERLGYSCALNATGNIVAVGSYSFINGTFTNAGKLQIFQNQNGTWTNMSTILGTTSEFLGYSCALNATGNIVAVGSYSFQNGAVANAGKLQIFQNQNGTWTYMSTILGTTSERLGYSCELNATGDIVAVGSYSFPIGAIASAGKLQIFKNQNGTWTYMSSILGTTPSENLGSSCALNATGNIVAVGSYTFSVPGKLQIFNITQDHLNIDIDTDSYQNITIGEKAYSTTIGYAGGQLLLKSNITASGSISANGGITSTSNISSINASHRNISSTSLYVTNSYIANVSGINASFMNLSLGSTYIGISNVSSINASHTNTSITNLNVSKINNANIRCYGQHTLFGIDTPTNLTTSGGATSTAFGYAVLSRNTTGNQNAGFGAYTLYLNTTGQQNSAFGYGVLTNNLGGNYNSGFGFEALIMNESGNTNCAFGNSALRSNLGTSNNAFGYSALSQNTTGTENGAFGKSTMRTITTGERNSGFGNNALEYNETGSYNTAIGTQSLQQTRGNNNTGIGFSSDQYTRNVGSNNNTAIGYQALTATNASNTDIIVNSTAIGAGSNCNSYSNSTALGYNALCTAANQIMLGTSAERVVIPGKFSSNNASFTNVSIMNLTVNGTLFGGSSGPNASFTNVSILGNFSMPSTAYMNVSNASFTNISVTNLTVNNATIGILNSSSIYYSQKNTTINLSTILGTTSEYLGYSCAMNAEGDVVAVGSYDFKNGTKNQAGKLQILQNQNGTWTNMSTILGTTTGEYLGYSCALNATGDIVAVGSYSFQNGAVANAGKLQILQNQNGTWTYMASILGTTAERLGYSCALNATGDIVAVGSYYFQNDTMNQAGKLQILQNQNGTWTNMSTILGTTGSERLGSSCAMNATGDIVAVGSYSFQNYAGKLQILQNQNGTWTNMSTILGTIVYDQLGYSCALNATGNIVAVGSYNVQIGAIAGAGKLQILQNQNGTWTYMSSILGTTASQRLGYSCALNATGNIVAVGSHNFQNGAITSAGKLQILQNQNGTWTNMSTILGTTTENLGSSCALNATGNIVAVGSENFQNGTIAGAGKLQVFQITSQDKLNIDIDTGSYQNITIGEKAYSTTIGYNGGQLLINSNISSNNASFTNVSIMNLTINGEPYSSGGSGGTTIQNISNVSNVNVLNSSISAINIGGNSIISQSTSNTTNGIFISSGTTMAYPTDATFTRITMAPGTFMNVSNASFTNVSVTNLTVNNATIGILNSSSIYYSQKNINTNILTILGPTDEQLGNSCALNAACNIVAVGSFNFTNGAITGAGKLQIFQNQNGTWTNMSTILGPTSEKLGNSCALNASGNVLAVGSNNFKNGAITGAGKLQIFQNQNGTWTNMSTILGPTYENLGYSCALNASGNVLAVGSPFFTNGATTSAGKLQILQNQNGTWTNMSTILGKTSSEYLGYSCALNASGDILAVGSPFFTNGAITVAGKLQIFQNQNGTWTYMSTILGPTSEYLGNSCGLNAAGNILAVGSSGFTNGAITYAGKLQIFQNQNGTWTNMSTILGPTYESLGNSCALNAAGNILAVGSNNFTNGAITNAGKLQIFQNQNGTWTNMSTILGTTATEYLGSSCALNATGNIVAVGTFWFKNGAISYAGKLQIFQIKQDKLNIDIDTDSYQNITIGEKAYSTTIGYNGGQLLINSNISSNNASFTNVSITNLTINGQAYSSGSSDAVTNTAVGTSLFRLGEISGVGSASNAGYYTWIATGSDSVYSYIDFHSNTRTPATGGHNYDARILAGRGTSTTTTGTAYMNYYASAHNFYSGSFGGPTKGAVNTGPINIYEATGTGDSSTAATGSLVIEHGNSGGVSSIIFPSFINRGGADYGYIRYRDNVTGTGESARFEIGIENDSDDHLVLQKNNGFVGIGTINPAYKLDVTGDARVTGTLNAATFNSTSDIRVKNIIRYITIEETLNFIDNTNPILFKWKDNNENIIAGYIAQEVIKTQADHLVYTSENSNMKESDDGPEGKQYYLNYDGIIPYHGVAIKHLLQENTNLKEEVKDLSIEVKDLSTKMNELSKELLQLKEMIKANR